MARQRPARCARPTGLSVTAEDFHRVLGGFTAPEHFAPTFVGSVVGISATGPVEVWATSDVWFVWLYDPQREIALARSRLGDIYDLTDPHDDVLELFARLHAKPGLFSMDDAGCGLGICLYMGAAVAAQELSGGPLAGVYSQRGDRTSFADDVWSSLRRRGLSDSRVVDGHAFDTLSASHVHASGHFLSAGS